MTTSRIGRHYPAPQSWTNHQRVTDMLSASVKLQQAQDTLEAMREAVRKQESFVESLRDKQYSFRVIK